MVPNLHEQKTRKKTRNQHQSQVMLLSISPLHTAPNTQRKRKEEEKKINKTEYMA